MGFVKWRGGMYNYWKQGYKDIRPQEPKKIGQPKGEKQVYRYAGTQVCREKKN